VVSNFIATMKHKRISEFAKSIGVSHTAIAKAIAAGRIPESLVETKQLPSGRQVKFITNPVAARSAFLGDDFEVEAADTSEAAAALDRDDDAIPPIAQSRAAAEFFKAKSAKLEYERESGKLVDAEEFKVKFSTMVTVARTRLLAVPSKAKGRIPHLTLEDLTILTSLIREALEGLAEPDDRLQKILNEAWEMWRAPSEGAEATP
jgi:phage terminase Nu1 subunit (DNA packaging protein)